MIYVLTIIVTIIHNGNIGIADDITFNGKRPKPTILFLFSYVAFLMLVWRRVLCAAKNVYQFNDKIVLDNSENENKNREAPRKMNNC